jgi:glycosyltransferase involved in cell wall biosynthesis
MSDPSGGSTGGPGFSRGTGEIVNRSSPEKLTINWIFPRPNLTGGIKSNRLIAEAMVRRGHDVNLCFPVVHPWPRLRRPRSFLRRALSEWRASGKPRHHLETSTARLVPVASESVTAADVPDADVCIATWWRTVEWVRDFPASKGIKAHFIRHYEVFGGDPERVDATYRLPFLKLVIAGWLEDLMRDRFGDANAVLVRNAVDRTQFHAEPRGKNATPTVGMLYGDVEWKGAGTGFEALRLAQRSLPALRVIAFGASPIPRSMPVPDNFEFHERPPQSEIPRLYRRCDSWLVPSTSEGFGMPGLEAAACRCPIVSTRCGGPEEYVRHGVNGYLVDVGDAEQMASRLLEVVGLDEARWRAMSEASAEIAAEFDWDASAEILERALLERVRAGPQGSAG